MSQVETTGLENLSFDSSSSYSVVKKIGGGGMGIVYCAEQNTGDVIDQVVLKCLKTIDPDEEEKLKQEASIATMLRHENVVKTYGMEMVPISKFHPDIQKELLKTEGSNGSEKSKLGQEEKKIPLLVMDYIKGLDFYKLLVDHLRSNLLFPVPLAAFVISRIASALSYAHTYIVHRDVSPENILISTQGVCKLTDFGVAVVAHTQPQYWAGKLMYMAPEQIRNDPIDERADIFALGLVAYQAVTGIPLLFASPRHSFEDQVRVIYSQMENSVVPPHRVRKDVPKELSRIITKMLTLAPEYRYQRASTVVNDLEKDFLYAKGFGPTNNSLAAYIQIFNSNFQDYNEDQLQQLSFLKDEEGRIQLKRPLTVEGFTKAGQRLLAERKGSLIVSRLKEIHREKRKVSKKPVLEKVPYIKVKYLDNVVEAFSLEQGKIVVGRSSKNSVVLPNKTVSGRHACFYLDNGVPILEDLDSHNGTLVNGEKIKRTKLHEGDKIQIGPTIFYFLREQRNTTGSKIISLNNDINFQDLKNDDITIQFYPTEEVLGKINEVTEYILSQTPIGIMKQNVLPPALYEAVRLFSGEISDTYMTLQVLRSRNYIAFRCSCPKQSYGYEAFLSSIYRRMDSSLDSKTRLEPEELALSLILKVLDRIETFRFSREILMTSFF